MVKKGGKRKMFQLQVKDRPAFQKKNKYKKYFTQIRNLKNEIVTYHHRIDFIVVAIHPIGGHGFSVFDANFGHFLSGAG
jgi:hypothetical protein